MFSIVATQKHTLCNPNFIKHLFGVFNQTQNIFTSASSLSLSQLAEPILHRHRHLPLSIWPRRDGTLTVGNRSNRQLKRIWLLNLDFDDLFLSPSPQISLCLSGKEARIHFWILIRYGGTAIPKKLGYGYGGVYFLLYIFINCYAYNF